MVDSGAAQRIASTLISKFGVKNVQWALIIIGAVFGISVFYEVAFMILAPLVISIAVEAKTPFELESLWLQLQHCPIVSFHHRRDQQR